MPSYIDVIFESQSATASIIARDEANDIRSKLRWFLAVLFAPLAISLVKLTFLFIVASRKYHINEQIIVAILLMFVRVAIAGIPAFVWHSGVITSLHHFEVLCSNKELIKIAEPSSIESIANMVISLKEEMKIGNEVIFWKAKRSLEILPSIVMKDNIANLVIPMGLVMLSEHFPNRTKAILAHELGHIRNHDTELWMFSYIASNEVYNSLRAVLIFSVIWYFSVGILFTFHFQNISFEQMLGICIDCFVLWYCLRRLRILQVKVISCLRNSEFRADLCAAHYVGAEPLREAISKYVIESKLHNKTHPSISERLKRIHEWLEFAQQNTHNH